MALAEWYSELWMAHLGDSDISIPLQGGAYYHPSMEDIRTWREAFPLLNVMDQLKKCAAWNHANPSKRKTIKGIRRHVVFWLSNQKVDDTNTAEERVQML